MDNKTKKIMLLVSVVIALQIVILVKVFSTSSELDSIKNELGGLRNRIVGSELNINGNISSIKNDLEKGSSILEKVSIEASEVNKEDLSYTIQISVVPKEISEDSKVTFEYRGEKIVLEKMDNIFKGTVDARVSNGEDDLC